MTASCCLNSILVLCAVHLSSGAPSSSQSSRFGRSAREEAQSLPWCSVAAWQAPLETWSSQAAEAVRSGFGVSIPATGWAIPRHIAIHRHRLSACASEGNDDLQLRGERLQKALQYQKVFNEEKMGIDMRKFNIQKVREGKPLLLLESRLAKASRYASLFETEGQRGIERALRVEVSVARDEEERKEEELSHSKKRSMPKAEERRTDAE